MFDDIDPRVSVSYKIVPKLFDLEKRIDEFEKMKFPELCLPKGHKKKKKKKRPNRSVIRTIEKIPKKNSSVHISLRPSPMPDFKLPKIEKEKLGPGCYFSQVVETLPGSYISKESRFKSSLEERAKYFTTKRNYSDNIELFQSIEKRNKDLEQFLPVIKEKNTKEKIKDREIKSKIQQKAKEILEDIEQKVKSEKYHEKISKHEWKNKIQELSGLAKVCYNILGVLEIASLIRQKIIRSKVIFI